MERFAAIPGNELIEQHPQLNAGGEWTLPNGSVLAQTLCLDVFDKAKAASKKRIETRLLTRQHGEWVGYSYKWNDAQTDAELIGDAGGTAELEVPDDDEPTGRREQVCALPSRAECMNCHSRAKGFILSFTTMELDRDGKFGEITDNQLRAGTRGLLQGRATQTQCRPSVAGRPL